MKKIKIYSMLLSILVSTTMCNKNEDVAEPNIEIINVNGKVVDENGAAIVNAEILFENKSTTTNATGDFNISANKNDKNRQFIIVRSINKFEAYRAFSTNDLKKINLEVRMLNKGTVVNFSSSSGAIITNNGGSISIPVNSIQKENGEIYNGPVTASVRMLNNDLPNFEQLMQGGDFEGLNSSNQAGNLRSYGFYAAELEDSQGNKLNLKTGTSANFSLPLSAALATTAPQTVKLWHFDKNQAIWIENGTASKIGNKYVGTVPHFSEWNCDDWISTSTLGGSWQEVPSSNCAGSNDVANINLTSLQSFFIYNMPQASTGRYYFKNGALNNTSCDLYVLYMPNYNITTNIYYSVPTQASGWLEKTGSRSFTYSCTLSNDFTNFQNPSNVIGINGSGTY